MNPLSTAFSLPANHFFSSGVTRSSVRRVGLLPQWRFLPLFSPRAILNDALLRGPFLRFFGFPAGFYDAFSLKQTFHNFPKRAAFLPALIPFEISPSQP